MQSTHQLQVRNLTFTIGKMKIGIITGGFDPLHSGHISYINEAKKLCDFLVVGVNSDEWLVRKKGKPFLPISERKCIINAISGVDLVIDYNDSSNDSFDAILKVKEMFPENPIVFMNGGDRTEQNIPEINLSQKYNVDIEFIFGVGGVNKANSSSWILSNWKYPQVERPWGYFRIVENTNKWRVKELVILPGKSLSMQRHSHRSEHWHVLEGRVTVDLQLPDSINTNTVVIEKNSSIDILKHTWHRAYNTALSTAKVIEIWSGDVLTEEDIERK